MSGPPPTCCRRSARSTHCVRERWAPGQRGYGDGRARSARGSHAGCLTRARAHVRARRRARGAQPVGVRAHALLPPQARRHEPHHPHRLRAASRSSPAGSRPTRRTGSRLRRELPQLTEPGSRRWDFPFGTDQLGRDYLSRVIYGIQTSLGVAIVVALLSTFIGTADRRGRRLLRRRDRQRAHALHRPHPHACRASRCCSSPPRTSARRLSTCRSASRRSTIPQPMVIGLILAFLFWTGIARIVRGLLPLAPREGVRRGSEGRRRRRPAHHRAAHPPQLRRPDRRQHDAHHRGGDPHRGGALVPRLRHPAAGVVARQAHRRRSAARVPISGGSSCSLGS